MKSKPFFRFLLLFLFISLIPMAAQVAPTVITLSSDSDNDCEEIRKAVDQVKALNGAPSIIKFAPGVYNLKRTQASSFKYHISNTLSWSSSPDNIKYIGIYLKDISNLTIDATDAKFITHGEMTSFVMDGCQHITFKNFVLDAADPSLTEMTVERVENDRTFVFKAHETSNYQISGTTLRWSGEGWSFTGGPSQIYDPTRDISWRAWNPQEGIKSATDLGDKRLRIEYNSSKEAKVGYTFQMRDGVRDQVAGFILKSKNVNFEGLKMHFLGNFGIVCQYSEGLSFTECIFAPDADSGRTSAGFADFLQVSGCKGLLKVEDCKFQGAHDDPINVHGTYLKVVEYISPTKLKVQFQHHESWGFEAFFIGDKIELIDASSMLSMDEREIVTVNRVDDRNIIVELDTPIEVGNYSPKTVVLENITWTPEVEIRRCHFSRIPTRGVLITTRGRSVIEDNTFYKMQMVGIYVSGDARSWYESGKVTDLTIRRNKFVECGSPVIFFDPTNQVNAGSVHSNVTISENEFYIKTGQAVGGKSVDRLTFINNRIYTTGGNDADSYCSVAQSTNVVKSGNSCINPRLISLNNVNCYASSNATSTSAEHVIDGKTGTSWRPTTGDSERYLMLSLPSPTKINGLDILSANNFPVKCRIQLSNDSIIWGEAFDYSDNTITQSLRTLVGSLGDSIRFVRIDFVNTSINISEVRLYGGDTYHNKIQLIPGVVIGTAGSWGDVLSNTKEAVFDFDTDSFFDAPSSNAWVGLDFGKERAFSLDSIRFAPRVNSNGGARMLGGRIELSNHADFSNPLTVHTIEDTPPSGYTHVAIDHEGTFRYARYVSPDNGFCNIAELEFYGSENSLSSVPTLRREENSVKVVRKAHGEGVFLTFPADWSHPKEVRLYSSDGKLINVYKTIQSELTITAKEELGSIYIVTVSCNGITQNIKFAS